MEPTRERLVTWKMRVESIARELDAVRAQLAYVLDRVKILAEEVNRGGA
jgi:uncharacterized membrane protein